MHRIKECVDGKVVACCNTVLQSVVSTGAYHMKLYSSVWAHCEQLNIQLIDLLLQLLEGQ